VLVVLHAANPAILGPTSRAASSTTPRIRLTLQYTPYSSLQTALPQTMRQGQNGQARHSVNEFSSDHTKQNTRTERICATRCFHIVSAASVTLDASVFEDHRFWLSRHLLVAFLVLHVLFSHPHSTIQITMHDFHVCRSKLISTQSNAFVSVFAIYGLIEKAIAAAFFFI
jgi:hypothetical protein